MDETPKFSRKPDHALITRRDFISQGVIPFAAVVSFPGILGFGMKKAMADCGGTVPTMVPFMAFDMAGGAGYPGNFLVGKEGGPENYLSSYDLLGWDPRASGALNKDFGLPMSAKYSKILEGILGNSSAEARKNLRMASICHFAVDDTPSNKLNAASLALTAGYRGAYISNGLSTINTNPHSGSASVLDAVAFKPTFVRSVTDVLGATSFGGSSFTDTGISKLKAMATGGVSLSRIQKELFMNMPGGKILAELSKCAYEKSLEFVSGVQGLDPRADAFANAAYNINQNTDPASTDALAASLTMNTLRGNSGPSVWILGDCDYHTGTQEKGDGQDLQMGIQIGKALELAHLLQKPLFFQLLTDGGVGAQQGTRQWAAEAGEKCMTVMGYYDPKGPPTYYKKRQQIGYYTNGQGAERGTLIGSDPQLVGYAVFANYLNICGKLGDFSTLAPGVFTGAGQLDSVLAFEGKVT